MFAGVIAAMAGIIIVFLVSSQAAGFALASVWFVVLGAAAFLEARSLVMHRAAAQGFGPSRVDRR